MKHSKRLEWAQTILGLTAAFILASNPDQYWGFIAMCLFLIKDTAMIVFCRLHNFHGLMVSALGYLIIDTWGVYRWWIF